DIGAVLVLDKKKLEGILSERDFVRRVIAKGKDPAKVEVSQIMTAKVVSAGPHDSVSSVLNRMQKLNIRHIPIVDEDLVPIGIVSARDLMARTQIRMKRLIHIKNHYMTHDALTGLKNYRFFNDYLDIEITRSQYTNSAFSLLSMDLDNFKELNDTAGHPIGNLVLMRFGELLRGKKSDIVRSPFSLRKSDVPVRFGGDEFSLILPDTNPAEACRCAERVLESARLELNNLPGIKPPIPITISIGIATFPNEALDRQSLIRNSDLALYEAKRLGKNQICSFTPALLRGTPKTLPVRVGS
ncbi:MAG: GGDEF domain-containing protein, partial [Candidatus Omnitrophota bacterium]